METVTVRNYDNYFSANIVLARLQQEGIPCYLKDEHSATIYPIFSNAIGGVKLEVATENLAAALELLKQYDEEYLAAAICPECHQAAFYTTEKKLPGNIITNLLAKLIPGYVQEKEIEFRCRNCGYGTKSLPESFESNNPAVEL